MSQLLGLAIHVGQVSRGERPGKARAAVRPAKRIETNAVFIMGDSVVEGLVAGRCFRRQCGRQCEIGPDVIDCGLMLLLNSASCGRVMKVYITSSEPL
jgi:hypothetical protein